MDEEMRFHIESEIAELVARGMETDVARRVALVRFGGVERFKEEARDSRGIRAVHDLTADARYALRVLRRRPGFTLAAVCTLALGVGANSAIFSVVQAVLFRPLPYERPDRLAVIWERNVLRGKGENVAAVTNFEAWRDRNRSFESLAALVPAPTTLTLTDRAEHVVGAEVSSSYFDLLGVRPAIGRAFSDEEAISQASVVVLGHTFWQRYLGSDPRVVGRTVVLDNDPWTVVGVMSADFRPPQFGWLGEHHFWIPFQPTADNRQWGRFLLVLGRLRDDVAVEQADSDIAAIAQQLSLEKESNAGWSADVVGLSEQVTGDVRSTLLVLLAAVGLLLLMATANVANLMLAHLRRAEYELAVRVAIGASRQRLLRQLLTQGAILGLIGGTVGLGVGVLAVEALVTFLPPDVPRGDSIRIDGAVLLFTLGVSLLATLAFSALPALRGTRFQSTRALHGAQGRSSPHLGGGDLIVAEIALAVVLTLTAGLTVRSLAALRSVDLGFDASNVLALRLALPIDRYAEPAQRRWFFTEAAERIRALPGVESVGTVSLRPLGDGEGTIATTVLPAGRQDVDRSGAPVADVRYTDTAYFRVLRIPLLTGRVFDRSDRTREPEAVVVNATMARLLWPDESAVGQGVWVNLGDGIIAEVIGVVDDVRINGPRVEPRSTVYREADRVARSSMDFVVRSALDAAVLAPAVRQVVRSMDPALPIFRLATLEDLVETSMSRDRFTMLLLGGFATVSLVLAAVGIYGVLAGDVVRRRKEIGIRVALGARTATVIGTILRRGLGHSVVGVAIGIVAALPLTRFMRAMLFGVRSTDPVSYVAVAGILLAVAASAALVPAVRASRIAPMTAIRDE
jgi:predicted permease